MRLAALYDIHGNLPALEAVLADVRQARVDQIVVGGDVIPGPMPRETLACLLNLEIPAHFIFGNCEIAVLEQMAGREPARVPDQFRPIIRWTAEQLGPEYRQALASWPKTVHFATPDLGDILFCHATPRNEDEAFTRLTAEEKLMPIFEAAQANLVVCGHTHMQFDRGVGSTRVVNAGSVGMPFGNPGAYWLLLGSGVELRHTSYDLARAAERIRQTAYPGAEEFAAHSVLAPPSEDEMLRAFGSMELE
jgi:predicted phosphodiesterase